MVTHREDMRTAEEKMCKRSYIREDCIWQCPE